MYSVYEDWLFRRWSRIIPEQQLQLRVQESKQRPPADDLGVAVTQCTAAVAGIVRVQTLGSCGQRHDLGWSEVKPWKGELQTSLSSSHFYWANNQLWWNNIDMVQTRCLIWLRTGELDVSSLLSAAWLPIKTANANRSRQANEKWITEQTLLRLRNRLSCCCNLASSNTTDSSLVRRVIWGTWFCWNRGETFLNHLLPTMMRKTFSSVLFLGTMKKISSSCWWLKRFAHKWRAESCLKAKCRVCKLILKWIHFLAWC